MSVAFVFPGQGSQYVGMGQDLVREFPEARDVFEEADSVLGIPLTKICFEGPDHLLTDTINAQPALLTHSVAALRIIQKRSATTIPAFLAGHSLGEYSALVAGQALSFSSALVLVRERGRVMKQAGAIHPGLMAAVLGLADDKLEQVCIESGAQIANYNAPGQTVVSGSKQSIERAISLAKERGAKRVVPLAVSIAAHSRLMESAAQHFAQAVAQTPIQEPLTPVISNITARPLASAAEIHTELVMHLTTGVQWVKSVEYMATRGVTRIIEVGPRDVYAGLVRRIDRNVHAISIGDVATVRAHIGSQSQGD